MCGIAGLLPAGRRIPSEELGASAAAMAGRLAHRGPDDRGEFVDLRGRAAFGHRRLAVYDTTDAGHQPMTSPDGRWTVAFNGAVYNHRRLRDELEGRGRRFRGRSDTEVLVAALAEWGVPAALERLNGMFAFGAWDAEEGRLWLVRDHLGEKPLYYGRVGGAFAFASELKAFDALPGFERGVDPHALHEYLRLGYVPTPLCIHPGLAKLPPGTYLAVDADGSMHGPTAYWSAADAAAKGVADPFTGAPEDAVAALHELLLDAVDLRTEADVPVGAFLSGGVDSSLVVALMQARHPGQVRTFTAAFDDPALDEAHHARAVAERLGAEHTELPVSADDCRALVPQLPRMFDEPFADVSQVPLHLLAARARPFVTVALTGDGGDEVFGGYNRYAWLPRLARFQRLPSPVRATAASVLAAVPARAWDRVRPDAGEKAHKLARVVAATDVAAMRAAVTTHWAAPPMLDRPIHVGVEAHSPIDAPLAEQLMQLDAVSYLPDDILTKVDRATMAVALEARVPYLDHRVFELAWRLPPALRQRRWALRQVLYQYVPAALVDRPKAGFDPPVATWLRGPMRPWAEDLLAAAALVGNGLDPAPVRAAWQDHLTGRANRAYELWTVLMYQAWAAR